MPEPPISDAEIKRLASDEGWNETEIDAIRAYLGRSDASEPAVPGASVEPPPPDVASEQPGVEPAPPTLDQDWLRGRRGPAATAYRRLRRLIQG